MRSARVAAGTGACAGDRASAMRRRPGRSAVPALHGLVGGVLLLAPGRLLRGIGDPGGRRAGLAARVLGARHISQALLLQAWPGPAVARFGAAVDGLHCASMLAVGALARRHRRAALVSSLAAAAFAVLELAGARDG
jgi:hypothetical protein